MSVMQHMTRRIVHFACCGAARSNFPASSGMTAHRSVDDRDHVRRQRRLRPSCCRPVQLLQHWQSSQSRHSAALLLRIATLPCSSCQSPQARSIPHPVVLAYSVTVAGKNNNIGLSGDASKPKCR